jgi:hypothetical protein
VAIGSLDKAGRLEQLKTFASVQVRAGYRDAESILAEVFEAVRTEVGDDEQARRLSEQYVAAARRALDEEAVTWPATTEFDQLEAAFAELEASDIVVLQACEDHWAANEVLSQRAAAGHRPRGIAYFTPTDVWHAVEHQMLEVNVWHGDSANVLDTDQLLADVIATFERHGLAAHFDEGRIEVTVRWQRRLSQRIDNIH